MYHLIIVTILTWMVCSGNPTEPGGVDSRLVAETATNQSNSILELYKYFRNTENPSLKEVEAIKQSDTIRSYVGRVIDGHFYTTDSNRWRVVFPTFHELTEDVLLAELHVTVASTSEHIVGIDVNQMLRFPCDSSTPITVCRRKKLLAGFATTKYVYDNREETVIDFTEEINNWLSSDGPMNRMAELWSFRGTEADLRATDDVPGDIESTSGHRRKMVKLLSDSDFHSTSQPDVAVDNGMLTVSLIVYTSAPTEKSIVKDRLSLSLHNSNRTRRSTSADERSERRKQKKEKELRKERREELRRAREEKLARMEDNAPCRVVEMDVDFEEIGWSRWILYPKNFNAKRCAGRCTGPLDAIHNPSNHAVMQDLIRLKMPGRAPEPCCIPTKLQPLSMLYVEEGTIVVRHHEEMLVEECGCR